MKVELKLTNGQDVFSVSISKNIDEEAIASIVNVGLAILQMAAEYQDTSPTEKNKQLPAKSSTDDDYLSDDDTFYHAYKATNDKYKNNSNTNSNTNSGSTGNWQGYSGGYSHYNYYQDKEIDLTEFDVFKDKTGTIKITVLNMDMKYRAMEAMIKALKIPESEARKYIFDNVEIPTLPLAQGVELLKEFKKVECYVSYKIKPLDENKPTINTSNTVNSENVVSQLPN